MKILMPIIGFIVGSLIGSLIGHNVAKKKLIEKAERLSDLVDEIAQEGKK